MKGRTDVPTSKSKPGPGGSGAKTVDKPRWKGTLAEKLQPAEPMQRRSTFGGEEAEASLAAEQRRWAVLTGLEHAAAAIPKMYLLLEHYRIERREPECWFVLALALAKDHVPGFQEELPAGRPSEWDSFRLLLLRLAVDQKMEERAAAGLPCTVADACRFVASDPRLAGVLGRQGRKPSAGTLHNRYRDSLADAAANWLSQSMSTIATARRSELIEELAQALGRANNTHEKA